MARGRKRRLSSTGAAASARFEESAYTRFCREHVNAVFLDDQVDLDREIGRIGAEQAKGLQSISLDYEIAMRHRQRHFTDVLRTVQIGVDEDGFERRQLIVDCRLVDTTAIRDLLIDPRLEKQIWNATFERGWSLERYGAPILGVYDGLVAMQVIQSHLASLDEDARTSEMRRLGLDWQTNPDAKRKLEFFGPNGLGYSAERLLGVSLPKEEQTSDWGTERFSHSQALYMVIDAAILPPLISELKTIAAALGVEAEIAKRLAGAEERSRIRVEQRLAEGTLEDESDLVEGTLWRSKSVEELDHFWDSARTVALSAPGFSRLQRAYNRRRVQLARAA
jgi:hypothetical protein